MANAGSAHERRGFTEDELVGTLRRILAEDAPGVVVGPGDDAALVQMGDRLLVLTSDLLVEGVHFSRETVSARDLGYKALVVNVSDVAAMGGSPRYALVSLTIPPEVESGWVVELYGGLREAAAEYATSLVGGDTSRADQVVISVALAGEAAPGASVLRSGARPGDRIVVTGRLGASAGGLLLSQAAPHEVSAALVSDWGRELLAAHFRPTARVGEGQTLAAQGATAMIDVSDGLTLDLSRLCRESGVGAALSLADVPWSPGLKALADVIAADPLGLALQGGEDYELLATLPTGVVDATATVLGDRFATALTDIGEIREGEALVVVESDGSERPLEPQGWDHFGG
jgi:thiamine-monophosphate kinase